MSALGHKQTWRGEIVMSALAPISGHQFVRLKRPHKRLRKKSLAAGL